MSFLSKSTGQTVGKTAQHETDGNVDVLPKNTRVTAAVDDVQWREPSEGEAADGEPNDQINIQWRIQGGQFDNKVIFQKLRVLANDEKKRDNALDFYAATDTILNEGFLLDMGEEPTDDELLKAWMGKKADLVLDVWTQGKGADRKQGNFVKAVYAAGTGGSVEGEGRRRRRTETTEDPAQQEAPRRRRRTS